MLTWIAAALFAAALLLFLRNRHHRHLGGLPSGKLVSSDNAPEECPFLVSHRYGLKGKPLLNLLRKLNSGDRHSSSIEPLESEHGTDPLFNSAMVFDDIVQLFAGSDPYSTRQGSQRFQFGDCSM